MKHLFPDYQLKANQVYIRFEYLNELSSNFFSQKHRFNILNKNVLYEIFGEERIRYVKYSDLGIFQINALGLPSEEIIRANLLDELISEESIPTGSVNNTKEHDPTEAVRKMEMMLFINKQYNSGYRQHKAFYYNKGLKTERIDQLARTHAIIELALGYKEQPGYTITSFFEVLTDLNFSGFSINLTSLNYFQKLLRGAEKNSIPDMLLHGLRGKPSNNKKINKAVGLLILFFKRDGNNISNRLVATYVNTVLLAKPTINGGKTISRKAVTDFLQDPFNRNIVKFGRLSRSEFIDELTPYLVGEAPVYPCDQWAIDGTKLQFICKTDEGLKVRLTLIMVLDSFSKRVMGYAIGRSENSELALEAFKMAILACAHKLPSEVVSDRGPGFKKEFKRLIDHSKDMGVEWHQSSNPRAKNRLERAFMTLQTTVFSQYFGYIGEGIKSRSKNARPNKDIMFLLRDVKYLRNEEQLKGLVDHMIKVYNDYAISENGQSPNEFYREKLAKHAIKITPEQLALMTYSKHEVSGRKASIEVQHNGKRRVYSGYETVLVSNIQDGKVDVYIDYNNDQFAYIFRANTSEFLGKYELRQRVNTAKVNRTRKDEEEIARHYKRKRKMIKDYEAILEDGDNYLKTELGSHPSELMSTLVQDKEVKAGVELNEILGDQEHLPLEVDRHNLHKEKGQKGHKAAEINTAGRFHKKGSLSRVAK